MNKNEIEEKFKKLQDYFGFNPLKIEQQSDEWFHMRLGVQTASNAAKILADKKTQTKKTYIASLVAQILTKEMPEISGRALDHGNENEEAARSAYELQSGLEVIEYPFIFGENLTYGCSPDGLIFDDSGELMRGIEIKAPFNSENHIKFICNEEIKPEYRHQVQFSMFVTGAKEWDFGSYDYRCSIKPIHWVTIRRDEKAMKQFRKAIEENNKMIEEMLSKFNLKFGYQWV